MTHENAHQEMQEKRLTTWRHVAPTRDTMTPEQAEVYDGIVHGPRGKAGRIPVTDEEGRLLGPFALMAISPAVGDAVQRLGAQIRFEGVLSDLEREVATLTVAAHHRSDFEWFAHSPEATRAGLRDADLADIKAGRAPQFGDPRLRLVSSVSATLLRDGTLGDADYRAATDTLGEAALIELIWLCGYYSMLAVALSTMRPGVPADAQGIFVEE